MGFKIEDGIEMPDQTYKGGRPAKYPFDQMAVGQSFFVPADGTKKKSVRAAAHGANKRSDGNRTFVTRSTTENGVEGIRVWRV